MGGSPGASRQTKNVDRKLATTFDVGVIVTDDKFQDIGRNNSIQKCSCVRERTWQLTSGEETNTTLDLLCEWRSWESFTVHPYTMGTKGRYWDDGDDDARADDEDTAVSCDPFVS